MRRLIILIVPILLLTACEKGTTSKETTDRFLVVSGGKRGFIDKTGKLVIDPQFDGAGNFAEGLARVSIGNKWGFIDKTGKYVINPQFDGAGNFAEGLACVKLGNKIGWINKTGKYIWGPKE